MRSIAKLWKRLPLAMQAIIPAGILAVVLTMYFGKISTEDALERWFHFFRPWPYGFFDWLVNALAVAFVFIVCVLIWRAGYRLFDIGNPPPNASETQYRLLDDAPVGTDEADEFEREGFVATLARTIVLPPNANSLVLALEAPWGSGKSSVLALLCRKMVDHTDDPLIVRFNPWIATGQDRIFRAFFSQFSAALLDEGEKQLANKLVNFGEILEDLVPARARIFPRMGINRLRRIVGRIPVIDLEGEKDRLSATVAEVSRPIVVIVDDLDRLAPEDIRVVFQLVKAIAAFPRVAYLLAFDPEPIDRALAFGGDIESGRQFRDKIVQANIALPRIRYRTRKQYFSKRLEERLKSWQFSLDRRERLLLDRAIPLVLSALKTPRDMKRVLNKTLLTADNVRKEVNFADVLVFETLHAKFPLIVDVIRRNPRVVDPADRGDEEIAESEMTRMARQEMDSRKDGSTRLQEFADLYPNDREISSALLTFAFGLRFGESVDSDDMDPVGERRIAVHENLLKLLYQGLHGEMLSAEDAKNFLVDEAGRAAMLSDVLEAQSLSVWLAHVKRFVTSVDVAAPGKLMHEIALAVSALYERSHIDATDDARWVLLAILKIIPEIERKAAMEVFLGDHRTVSTGEEVLTSLLQDAGMWDKGKYFGMDTAQASRWRKFSQPTPEELSGLKELWLTTVREMGVRRVVMDYPNAGGVLFRWGQLSDPPYMDVTKELERALDDPACAMAFLRAFPPGTGLEGIERFVSGASRAKLRGALESPELSDSIKTKFLDYFDQVDSHQDDSSESRRPR